MCKESVEEQKLIEKGDEPSATENDPEKKYAVEVFDTIETEEEVFKCAEEMQTFQKVASFSSALSSQSSSPDIAEYECYKGNGMPEPKESTRQIVAEGLLEIVKVEGPMLAKRAYDIYLRHCGIKRMGKDLQKRMNNALKHAINKKLVQKEDEWNSGKLRDTIIRVSGQQAIRLRERGNRNIDEIPPSEIREAANYVLSGNNVTVGGEEHLRQILDLFGFKRLTEHTRSKLLKAIRIEKM